MGRLAQKKQEKKDKLLRSAFSLFKEKGIENTSISEIAHGAGVAKGTFYLYFKDKYALYEVLVARCANDILVQAMKPFTKDKASEPKTDKEWVISVMDRILEIMENDHSMLEFVSKNLSWGLFRSALYSPTESDIVDFRGIFSSLITEDGLLKYKDPELMIYMIIELVSSTCYSVILESSPADLSCLKPHLNAAISSIIDSFYIEDVSKRPKSAAAGL